LDNWRVSYCLCRQLTTQFPIERVPHLRAQDFDAQAPGRLLTQSGPLGNYLAYVPHPLPQSIALGMRTVALLSRADQALGELKGIGQMLPNPNLLINPFIRREAVSSSRMEGTVTDFEQLVLFELDQDEGADFADRQEVSNYVVATQYGLEQIKARRPIYLRLIRDVHERLMRGVRGEDKAPGEFRRRQNMIGRAGQTPAEARFVPPPIEDMEAGLDDLERYINQPTGMPVLIELALIHYQFETIHPFLDGNGRLGRLLINLLLCDRDCLTQPLLYLSSYLERHKDEYIDHLLRVSQTGDWQPWIDFFLQGVATQARTAIDRSNELLAFREHLKAKWIKARTIKVLELIDMLFERPAITITSLAQKLDTTFHAAQRCVEKLVADGTLKEVTGRLKKRVYLAPEIVRIINKDDP